MEGVAEDRDAYSTVSVGAIMVIASVIPIDLFAMERMRYGQYDHRLYLLASTTGFGSDQAGGDGGGTRAHFRELAAALEMVSVRTVN